MEQKLLLRTRLGYGAGYITTALIGDFMSGYFLYFLTTAAGIAPAFAGTIVLVGTITNAIANPIVGVYADKPGKAGSKKHRMLIKAIFLIAIFCTLLFTVLHTESSFKQLYYLAFVFLFYIAYAMYEVPYYAIAAGLTNDTDERTRLTSLQVVMSYSGSFVIGVFTPILLDKLVYSGAHSQGYAIIIGLYAVLAIICAVTCYVSTKKITEDRLRAHIVAQEDGYAEDDKLTFKKFFEMLKLKPLRCVMIITCAYYIYYNIYSATSYYFTVYRLGWSGELISVTNAIYVGMGILFAYLAGKFAILFDKKKVMIFGMAVGALSFIGFRFTGLNNLTQVMIWYTIDMVQAGIFWCLIYTMLYETIDIDEFKTGVRKEGTIMGMFTLIAVIGQAVAGQVVGIILQAGDVDTTALEEGIGTLSEMGMNTLYSCVTVYPGIFLVICLIFTILYPVSRKKLDLFQVAFEKKTNGEEYSTEGFEDIF